MKEKEANKKEIIENRNIYSKTFCNNNNSSELIISSTPLHYYNSSSHRYEEIDLDIKPEKGTNYVIDSNQFKTVINLDNNASSIFNLIQDGCEIFLSLSSEQKINKRIVDNKIIEIEDKKAIFQYEVLPDRIKEIIVINTKQDNYEFSFRLSVSKLEVSLEDNGNIIFIDNETKKNKFYIPKPFMIDANNKLSHDVDVLVRKENDNIFSITYIANEKWINEGAAFPVRIDPAILECSDTVPIEVRFYHKVVNENSSGTIITWEEFSGISPLSSDDRIVFDINASYINVPFSKIITVYLFFKFLGSGVIKYDNHNYNVGLDSSVQLDITNELIVNHHFQIVVDVISGSLFTFDIINFTNNQNRLDILYQTEEEINNRKEISLTNESNVSLDLVSGDFNYRFLDMIVENDGISFPITHIYKRGNGNSSFGHNYVLNLHQSITTGTRFFHNENGDYEKIYKTYYYIDDDQRIEVNEEYVYVGKDGELYYLHNNVSRRVYYELKTKLGNRFESRLEGDINGLDYLEQRVDEEKELENYLKDYIANFSNLIVFDEVDGMINEIQINFSLDSDNFPDFIENHCPEEGQYIIPYSSMFQWLEIGQNPEDNSLQLAYLKSIANSNVEELKEYYKDYLVKKKRYLQLKKITPTWVMYKNNQRYGFNEEGQLSSIFNENGKYVYLYWERRLFNGNKLLVLDSIKGEGVDVRFFYNDSGQLIYISNQEKKVFYKYEGNNLTNINYQDSYLCLAYLESHYLANIYTSNQEKIAFVYDNSNRLNFINRSAFYDEFDKNSVDLVLDNDDVNNLSTYPTDCISIQYQNKRTNVNYGDITESYFYNDDSRIEMSFECVDGIYNNLKITYFEDRDFILNIYPKKSYLRVDSSTEIDEEIDEYLPNDMPNINSLTYGQYPNYGEASYELILLNEFDQITENKTSWTKIANNKYQRTITQYFYNSSVDNKCIGQKIHHLQKLNNVISTLFVEVEEYQYDGDNRLTRKTYFVDGEKLINGADVVEFEYDEKGNEIVRRSYNTLCSSSKSYLVNHYENGLLVYDGDRINQTRYHYDKFKRLINKTSPQNNQIGYGYDDSNYLNSMSISTTAGENNIINRLYNFDLLMSVNDKHNNVDYTYDYKKRVKSINVNNVAATFNYKGHTFDSDNNISTTSYTREGYTFASQKAYEASVNLNDVTSYIYKDTSNRLIMKKEDDVVLLLNKYENDLLKKTYIQSDASSSSSGLLISYNYDNYRRIDEVVVLKSNKIIYEDSYAYNQYGNVSFRAYDIGDSSYTCFYHYSDDSKHTLTRFIIKNILDIIPTFDSNNRLCKQEYINNQNVSLFTVNINYVQFGDQASYLPSSVYYQSPNNSINYNVKYRYDSLENLIEIKEDDILTNRYQYDSLNRLIREDNRKTNKTFFYSYDNNGNILTKRESAFSLDEQTDAFDSSLKYYYNGDQLVKIDNGTISYDSFRRPVSYFGHSLTWSNNLLVGFDNHTFSYDGLGRRIAKDNISYIYDCSSNLIRLNKGNNDIDFLYDYSGVIGFMYNDECYLYHKNIQQDIIHIIKASDNSVVATYIYDAWGNHVATDSSNNVITNQNHIAYLNPFRFRSYYFDDETGMYYLKTRYYDPGVGRFISLDNLSYLKPNKPNGLNLFIYCSNNPVKYIDETGNDWLDVLKEVGRFFFILTGIGTVAGVIAGTAGTLLGLFAGAASIFAPFDALFGLPFGSSAVGAYFIARLFSFKEEVKDGESHPLSTGRPIYYLIDENDPDLPTTPIKIYNSSDYTREEIQEFLEWLKESKGYQSLNIDRIRNEWAWHKIAYDLFFFQESTTSVDAFFDADDTIHGPFSWIINNLWWF